MDGWHYANHDAANTNHAPDTTGPRESIVSEPLLSFDSDLTEGLIVTGGTLYLSYGQKIGAYSMDGVEQWTWTSRDSRAGNPVSYANRLLFTNTGGDESVVRFIETETAAQRLRATAGRGATITPFGEGVYLSGTEGLVSLDRSGSGQWQRPLDQPAIGTAVTEAQVLVTTEEAVVAVNRDDGKILWRQSVQPRHEPAVANGRVFTAGDSVVAFDSADGSELWRTTDLPTVTTIPAVTERRVYIGAGGDDAEETFFALNAETGEIQWQTRLGSTAVPTSSPATTRPAATGEMVYVGSNKTMHGLDAETGDIAWRATVDGAVGPPVPVDGQLLFTTENDQVLAVRGQRDGGTDEQSEASNDDDTANQGATDDDNDGDTGTTQSDGEDSDDGSGPGFGLSTGLTALGGVGYLLRRRLRSGREEPSREFREEMDQREE